MPDPYTTHYRAWRWQVPAAFNIAERCAHRWAQDPAVANRTAIRWEDEMGATVAISYAELSAQVHRAARALARLGVGRGTRVAICLPQRIETAVAHLACYELGAVAVPLTILFGAEALEYRLNDADCEVALVDPASCAKVLSVRARCPRLKAVLTCAGAQAPDTLDWEAQLASESPAPLPIATSPEDPALILYTSGTTGPPKGALIPQRALLGNLPGFRYSHATAQGLFPQGEDVFWSPADWAWTGGLWDALLPTLYHGATLVGYRGRFDPERAFELMARHAVTATFLFPTALKQMMKAVPRPRERYALKLRSIMSAGEAVGEAVFRWCEEALGITPNEMFGQTEANYIVGNSAALWPAKPGSMGRPYPGHRVTILDEEGRELPPGSTGEIAVHRFDLYGDPDPVIFLGYLGNEEATRAKFSGDWMRTGDLARLDHDGDLWYEGRSDDIIKSAGYRIGPAEVENCLLTHPAIALAAVIGIPDPERGQIVKAYCVLAPGYTPSPALEAELAAHVRGKLAPYAYPKAFAFVESLPMTTTGKIQRRVLRQREQAGSTSA
ncbi:MAG: AMP-binding protein [Casimicrobiaceae bacterium]|nr:AMP-binding protein [Casimicrobiaceae bacterium]MCX8098750.1 AMP-binding protein [Casimicrobiaceae bacterium]MDW8311627.1 AMP-binding protein [Burkholderiales bacterium]